MNSHQTTAERRTSSHNTDASKANMLTMGHSSHPWDQIDADVRIFICNHCETLPHVTCPVTWSSFNAEQREEIIAWCRVMMKMAGQCADVLVREWKPSC